MSAPTRARLAGVDHPSFIPAHLLPVAEPDPRDGRHPGRVRRSVRDWAVDVGIFLVSLLDGLVLLGTAASNPSPPADGLLFADLVAGVVACTALWARRRWPVALALVLALAGAFSDTAGIAVLVSLFTVAVHRRWPTVLLVSGVNLASFAVYVVVRPDPDLPAWVFAALGTMLTAAVVAWGMFVRARRQLVLTLHERAARAEGEQRLRVEQAQQSERTRIAREMHDVLAHRLSLLSMHAGALEFRPDAPPAEVARAAGVVRASARQALEDLREVIGVLRDDPDAPSATRPQPTLADLPALVEESRAAGLRVRSQQQVPDPATVPAALGRNAYRVVQEALTNVRKHAPGTVADVRVTGAPGAGLTLEVRNPAPTGEHPAPLPGGGTGLVGLAERVALAGGRLEHGRTADGGFRLCAELPWAAAPAGTRTGEGA
ncbi:histidine kinase [Modestobacter sp. NPDC049651]|uniref:sensor histidine kinase n=1 Tax=unclassified Modestobacter TaxID=2643866 RepID=UPI0033E1E12E